MGIFDVDGQAEVQSLSDEAIYGTEERQEDAQPQEALTPDATEPAEPASSAETGEAPAETPEAAQDAPEQEGQADPRDTRIRELEQQIEAANRQYMEMRKLDTRVAMENGELKRRLEQLQTRETEAQQAPAPRTVLSPEDQRAFAEKFLQNPAAALQEVMGEQIRQQAETAAKAMLEPLQRQEKSRQVGAAVDEAMREMEKTYPQAADSKERIKMLSQLGKLAEEAGMERNGWTNNPALFIQQAAIRLYGLPKQVDQAAIDRAVAQAKASALNELQAKDAGKAGLAPATATPQSKKNEEDDILAGIRAAAGGSGIFG